MHFLLKGTLLESVQYEVNQRFEKILQVISAFLSVLTYLSNKFVSYFVVICFNFKRPEGFKLT